MLRFVSRYNSNRVRQALRGRTISGRITVLVYEYRQALAIGRQTSFRILTSIHTQRPVFRTSTYSYKQARSINTRGTRSGCGNRCVFRCLAPTYRSQRRSLLCNRRTNGGGGGGGGGTANNRTNTASTVLLYLAGRRKKRRRRRRRKRGFVSCGLKRRSRSAEL